MDYPGAEKFVSAVLSEKIPATYLFHNLAHTQEVIANVSVIAGKEKISGEELTLLQTAALFHDTGYMVCYTKNEPDGVAFAARELPRFGYSPEQIAVVSDLIMATVFPQQPQNLLQQVLCDADLFYLTSDTVVEKAMLLRRELASIGRVFDDEAWFDFEMDFLTRQHFFTPYCEMLYQQSLPDLLRQIKNILIPGK